MRVADTSALYAFFNRDDAHHARALKAFQEPITTIVPAEIVSELLYHVRKRQGAELAVAVGEYLWGHPVLEVQPSDTQIHMAAWGEYTANNRNLSFEDCVVVAWCRAHDAQPLSYDKALLRAVRA